MTLQVQRGGSSTAGFEVAGIPIPQHLRPFIESWTGYREWSPVPVRRLEYPTGRAVLIIEFGAPLAVDSRRHRVGFFAGIDDGATLTEFSCEHAGIQINLSARGALAFADQPMHELARQVVSLDQLDLSPSLPDALAEAGTWTDRFGLVAGVLERRLIEARQLSPVTAYALARIDSSGGRVGVHRLATELGFSRKHLHERFLREVGLSPKRYADLQRFSRVLARLRAGAPSLAHLALDLGYSDQSHLARDVRRFSSVTARALSASLTDPIARAVHHLSVAPG